MKKNMYIISLMLVLTLIMGNAAFAACNVVLGSPDGGEFWSGTQPITWTATEDTPGECIKIEILYNSPSLNGAGNWISIANKAFGVTTHNWDTTAVGDAQVCHAGACRANGR